MKAWSRGRTWQVVTVAKPDVRGGIVLLTVHDAPRWIADEMRTAAERFVAPLELRCVKPTSSPEAT